MKFRIEIEQEYAEKRLIYLDMPDLEKSRQIALQELKTAIVNYWQINGDRIYNEQIETLTKGEIK